MSGAWKSAVAWLRRSLPTIVGVVLALAVAAFVGFSVWWFVQVVNDNQQLSAGDAFLGLAYFAGVVLVVLLVWVTVRYLTGMSRAGRSAKPTHLDQDRYLIVTQLRLGVLLIVFGAGIGIIFGLTFDDKKGVALALGTAAIGAGAAMLPGGASAQASNRIGKQMDTDADAAAAAGGEGSSAEAGATPEGGYDQDALVEHPDHPENDLDAGSAEVEGEPELVGSDEAVDGEGPPVLDENEEAEADDEPAVPPEDQP
jgi:hypothetical protein